METLVQLEPLPSLAQTLAVEEALGGGGRSRARLWRHRRSLVLGPRDARLPAVEAATAAFRADGYEVGVRSSGGRLVVLDEGILNVALAFSGEELPAIRPAFDQLTQVLLDLLRPLGLHPVPGEVPGSLCSGSSDLAVGGRKVAGLSQRRRRGFCLVHAFLLVAGRAEDRLAAALSFYRLAAGPPVVREGTMASLSDLLSRPVTVAEVASSLRSALAALP